MHTKILIYENSSFSSLATQILSCQILMNNSLTESTPIANIYYSNIYLTVLIWTTVSEADTTTRHFYARLLNWTIEILLLEIYTNIVTNRHSTCCYLTLLFSCSLYFVYFNFCIFYSTFVAVAFNNLHLQKWWMNEWQILLLQHLF